MSRRSASWVALRAILLLAVALPLSRITISVQASDALASAWLMPSIAGSAMALTCFLLQYQRMIPALSARWRRPTWLENPLSPHQPLQWSLLIAEAFMLSGLGCAAVDMLTVPRHCSWEIPYAAGIGIWMGTYLYSGLWTRRSHG